MKKRNTLQWIPKSRENNSEKKQTPKKLKKKKKSLYEATALMIDDKVKSGTFE